MIEGMIRIKHLDHSYCLVLLDDTLLVVLFIHSFINYLFIIYFISRVLLGGQDLLVQEDRRLV